MYDRIVKPKGIKNKDEEFKVVIQLLHIICRGPADQTLQEALKVARSNIFDKFVNGYEKEEVKIDILKEDKKVLIRVLGSLQLSGRRSGQKNLAIECTCLKVSSWMI